MKTTKNNKKQIIAGYSPIVLVVCIVAVIFLAELFIMLVLSIFPEMTPRSRAFADAILLIVLISPAIYMLIARPLFQQTARLREEMAERKRAESDLVATLSELEEKKAVTDAILEITHEVLRCRDFKAAAMTIFNKCKETIGATAGYVALLNVHGTESEVLFLDAGGSPCIAGPDLPMPIHGLTGEAYKHGKTVFDNNSSVSGWMENMPEGHVSLENVMFAPLAYGGVTHGIIGLANKKGGFSENDARVATAFSELAALSLQNIRLLELYEKGEKRLFRFLETLPVGVFVVDASGKPFYANIVAEQLLEWNTGRGELITDLEEIFNFYVYDTGKRYPYEKIPIISALAGESVFVNDIEIRNNDRTIPVEVFGYPIRDDNGKIIYAVAAIMDITDRDAAERELKESEERFRRLFEQNHDAIVIFDTGISRIVDANREAEKLFGCGREEILSSGGEFIDVVSLAAKMSGMSGQEGGAAAHENVVRDKLIRKDGDERTVDVLWQTVKLREGEFMYCSFRDVTEKIRMREEARERQAQLIHASKMASLGMLISGIAHEIGNPNNYILMSVGLLEKFWNDVLDKLDNYYGMHGEFYLGGLPFSEMRDSSPDIINSIKEGSVAIKKNLLELNEFIRHDRADIVGWVNVNEVVKASLSILSNYISRHTDNLTVRYSKNLPPVKGNVQKLKQVIINLMMNSLEALSDRKSSICVSTSYDENNRRVVVIIKDEGVGIPENIINNITEPFYTMKFDTRGTGLGLYIAHSILKEYGAELEFHSEPGKGTAATIKLVTAESA